MSAGRPSFSVRRRYYRWLRYGAERMGKSGCSLAEQAIEKLIVCGACGHFWHSAEDRAQAEAADAAYARHREEEEQRERDEARLGPRLVAVNQRMLEEQAARAAKAPAWEQLALV